MHVTSTVRIIKPGLLTSVQDLGREGYRHMGIATCGALDTVALRAANILLGNDERCAALECTYGNVIIAFHEPTTIALCGADADATVDGTPIPAWSRVRVPRDAVVELHATREQTRTILALPGGIDVPEIFASRSTDLASHFGGYNGRALRAGDVLDFSDPAIEAAPLALAPPPQRSTIRALDRAAPPALFARTWHADPRSNRMGARLTGEPLPGCDDGDRRSHGVLPGTIQLPADGYPMVLLADAQTTGGYTAIASVVDADLRTIGQVPLGAPIRFERVDLEQARQAQREVEAYLDDVRDRSQR